MSERKLATVRRIDKLEPIEGADKIWKATIGGWEVVTSKDNGFKEGDLVVYLEIDSWVPHTIAPFLTKVGQHPKVYNGVEGQRLKTIRLRGQLSQGMILPLSVLNGTSAVDILSSEYDAYFIYPDEGSDVTEALGIQKWEREIPATLSGLCKGNFPSFIPKTDQERAQNLSKEIFEKNSATKYEVSVKLDGSSMTVYHNQGEVGVCSRNLNLKLDQDGNAFVDTARNTGILGALLTFDLGNLAIQGELMGMGIQKNRENLSDIRFYVYDIWDIDAQKYLTPKDRTDIIIKLIGAGFNIHHVPVLNVGVTLQDLNITNMQELLKFADGESLVNKVREGLVYKSMDGSFSFKTISNQYLEKGGE